jgi:hypothetical protein
MSVKIVASPDVAEVLRTLRKVDPELQKATVRAMKRTATPMVSAGRLAVPAVPLTNWARRGRYRWDPKAVRRGINVTVRSNASRGDLNPTFGVFSFRMRAGLGPAFDMAGKFASDAPGTFTGNLNQRAASGGWDPRHSRLMVPVFDAHRDEVVSAVVAEVESAVAELDRKVS